MTRKGLFVTACLLTGFIAIACLNAMAGNNPKPVPGTINQGPTVPGNSPTPRPLPIGTAVR
ncbi:MAG TPA: hypothetical protein VNW97_07030 [Candidatus Saccharimonadales bacterium]|jgi:hypothetical protein|nr:hypothetical protein [Candidatus Saccharimonadales bacterium]